MKISELSIGELLDYYNAIERVIKDGHDFDSLSQKDNWRFNFYVAKRDALRNAMDNKIKELE